MFRRAYSSKAGKAYEGERLTGLDGESAVFSAPRDPSWVQIRRTSGNFTIPASAPPSWNDLDQGGTPHARPLDIVLPNMRPGDYFEYRPQFLFDTGAFLLLNLGIIKNGEVVRHCFNNVYGNVTWQAVNGQTKQQDSPSPRLQVQESDLDSGSLRLRLRYTLTTGSRAIYAIPEIPFTLEARGPFLTEPVVGLTFDGQSFVYAPANETSLAQRVAEKVPGSVHFLTGIPGTTYAQRASSAKGRVDYSVSNASRSILFDIGGQSDLLANMSAVDLASEVQSYVQERKSAGFDAVIGTTVPSMTSAWGWTASMEEERLAYNDLLRSQKVYDELADIASIAQLSDPANPLYFYDGLHPASQGADLIAKELVKAYLLLT